MTFELWELKRPWHRQDSRELLIVMLRHSAEKLVEGVSIPTEVDLLELLPEAIDPKLGALEMEAENVALAAEIQKEIEKYGVWISKSRTMVVTQARAYGDG